MQIWFRSGAILFSHHCHRAIFFLTFGPLLRELSFLVRASGAVVWWRKVVQVPSPAKILLCCVIQYLMQYAYHGVILFLNFRIVKYTVQCTLYSTRTCIVQCTYLGEIKTEFENILACLPGTQRESEK